LRWRISAVDRLDWRRLDEEIVVRNDVTGSTHLLDSLSAELLHTLLGAQTPLSAGELAAQLAAGETVPQEFSSSIEATLSEFKRLGLAEPSE